MSSIEFFVGIFLGLFFRDYIPKRFFHKKYMAKIRKQVWDEEQQTLFNFEEIEDDGRDKKKGESSPECPEKESSDPRGA